VRVGHHLGRRVDLADRNRVREQRPGQLGRGQGAAPARDPLVELGLVALAGFDRAATAGRRRGIERTRLISEANEAVHAAIVEAAQHPRLQRILNRTVDIPLVFRAFQAFDQPELDRSALFHRLIRNAIVAGDRARAGALMAEHILQGRDVLLGVLTDEA
jgi:DNA-binding GntR family transcriptional regulator